MLPYMNSKNAFKEYNITHFGGINCSFSQQINEFAEEFNMSSRNYPALSSAKRNKLLTTTEDTIYGGGFFDKLYSVEKEAGESGEISLMRDGVKLSTLSFESASSSRRKLEFMQDQFMVIPDNIIYHTDTDTVEEGNVSETTTEKSTRARFSEESPESTSMPMPYTEWYSSEISHNSVTAISSKYTVSGKSYTFYNLCISDKFEPGDVVTLRMNVKAIGDATVSERSEYQQKMADGITLKIKSLTKTTYETPSGKKTAYTAMVFEDNSISMGIFEDVVVMDITIEKTVPDFNDVCSFENRMWGVTDTEICASRLGDCSEWSDFSVDAYGTLPASSFRTGVESDGCFTAITSYNGNVIAFKEDCMHKIYGNEPAEYKLSRINCPGVQKGCRDTVAVAGGILIYKSRGGICAYNGSSFQYISRNLNIEDWNGICASGDERYYYIVVEHENSYLLLVYDTNHGIWHQLSGDEKLKFLIKTETGITGMSDNAKVSLGEGECGDWNFVLSFGKKDFSSRHICSVFVRYYLENGGKMKIQIRNKHGTYTLADVNSSAINHPIKINIPVSCAMDADLIFTGTGEFTLSSLTVRYKETGIND